MNGVTSIPPVVIFTELLTPVLNPEVPLPTRRQCARILRVLIQFCYTATHNHGERTIYNRLFALTLNLDQLDYHVTEALSAIYQEIHSEGHTAHYIVFLDSIAGVLESGTGDYLHYSCLFPR